jgi:3D (Asp-Asp-Asp) domain-containing protein
MLYGATAADNVRSIAMAVLRQGRWVRCGNNPVIRAGVPWAHTIAVDPSVLRIGPVTYVYYGGASNTGLGSNLSGAIGVARFVDSHRSSGRAASR